MGKRKHAFVFLSDDDDPDEAVHQDRPATRGSFLGPTVISSSLQTNIDDRSKICGPAKRQEVKCQTQIPDFQPWTEKYVPREISDLVVHAKKVADVREWMVSKLQNCNNLHHGGNVLLLSGPSGAGKTAVVRVVVDQFHEAELCEWDPPVPTLWKEHLHHVNADVPYISKVDQFVDFLLKVKKYPGLPLARVLPNELDRTQLAKPGALGKQKVLLIDDLPIVHGRELMSKLCHCLHNFASSVLFPTVVIATDFSEEEHGQGSSFLTADLIQALECGGAKKVLFNPITVNAVKKVLNKILLAEKCTIPSESVSFIAESCGGDIRHAINCLQFLCLGLTPVSCTWDPGGDYVSLETPKRKKGTKDGTRSKRKISAKSAARAFDGTLSIGCRDGSLSLFHALGKVLHNKRHTEENIDSGESIDNFILKKEFQRHPLKMEAPEVLVSQAHADSTSFLFFLHENVLEFVDDEGIEDVALAFTYFSDVDCLLKHKKYNASLRFSPHALEEIDPGHIAEAVAGSIAARGVLFANTHPVKPRWLSLRAPVIRQVDRLLNDKKAELRTKSWGNFTMFANHIQAAELEPLYKQMSCTSFSASESKMPSTLQKMIDPSLSFWDNELDFSHSFIQDEDLLPNIMAMDLSKGTGPDVIVQSEDEIEEW